MAFSLTAQERLIELVGESYSTAVHNEPYFKELIMKQVPLSNALATKLLGDIAATGSVAVAQVLIAKGAQITAESFKKALLNKNVPMIRLLLAHGMVPELPFKDLTPEIEELVALHLVRMNKSVDKLPENFWQLPEEERRKVVLTIDEECSLLIRQNGNSCTKALCALAKAGPLSLVPWLLKRAEPVAEPEVLSLPLIEACKTGNSEYVQLLLENGIEPDAQEKDGEKYTALMRAIEGGYVELVKLFFTHPRTKNKSKQLLAQTNSLGENALIIACSQRHDKLVNNIKRKKPTADRDASLLAAYADIVKFLVEQGASPLAEDNRGHTVFYNAACANYRPIVEYLVNILPPNNIWTTSVLLQENSQGWQPLMVAAREGNCNAAKTILSLSDGPTLLNKKDNDGHTPYLHAASCGKHEVMRLFCDLYRQNKNDPNWSHWFTHCLDEHNNKGRNALMLASAGGHEAAVNAYLEIYRIQHPKEERTELFIKFVVWPRLTWPTNEDFEFNTALHLAAAAGHEKIVSRLCEEAKIFGRDGQLESMINRRKGKQWNYYSFHSRTYDTPLHDAARNGHTKVVEILLSQGADKNSLTINGYRPYDVAKTDEIRQLLS